VVSILPGNFSANPRRQFNVMVLAWKFDFGYNQAEIFTRKHIDFPNQLAGRNDITYLFDDVALPK
jgi:hypothetical protein